MKLDVDVHGGMTMITRERDPEATWDGDDTETSPPTGATVKTGTGGYSDFEVDVKSGDLVYVVVVQYSSGDTFGHRAGEFTSVVAVLADKDQAERFADHLDKKFGTDPWEHRNRAVEYGKDDEFEGVKYHAWSWQGYFESYNSAYVFECKVDGKPSRTIRSW